MKTSCSKHTCLGSCWQARRGIFWYLHSRLPLLRSLTGDFGFLRGDFSAAGAAPRRSPASLLPQRWERRAWSRDGSSTATNGTRGRLGEMAELCPAWHGESNELVPKAPLLPHRRLGSAPRPFDGLVQGLCSWGFFQPHRCRRSTAQLTPARRGSGDVPAGLSDPQLLVDARGTRHACRPHGVLDGCGPAKAEVGVSPELEDCAKRAELVWMLGSPGLARLWGSGGAGCPCAIPRRSRCGSTVLPAPASALAPARHEATCGGESRRRRSYGAGGGTNGMPRHRAMLSCPC